MLQKKNTERNDTGKLMKFAQDKSPAQTNPQVRTPPPLSFSLKANANSGRL
jgi:hypothetical protein